MAASVAVSVSQPSAGASEDEEEEEEVEEGEVQQLVEVHADYPAMEPAQLPDRLTGILIGPTEMCRLQMF